MNRRLTYPVVHLELHTGDIAGARAFYGQLCGWRQEEVHLPSGDYLSVALGEWLGGGMVQCPVRRPTWLPYAEVDDVQLSTEQARLWGAAVLLEPREGPVGWRSVISTPAGGELALWQPKR